MDELTGKSSSVFNQLRFGKGLKVVDIHIS